MPYHNQLFFAFADKANGVQKVSKRVTLKSEKILTFRG